MEKTSDIICSECEFPVFSEVDHPVTILLDLSYGLVFCDLRCAQKFMRELSPQEIEDIEQEVEHIKKGHFF